jgi:rhomboid domain-containing protein 1
MLTILSRLCRPTEIEMEGGFLSALHFGTRFLVVLMVCIDIVKEAVLESDFVDHFSFCPELIINHGQIWRLVTSLLLHENFFHLAMNMVSFGFLGVTLESAIGTLSFIYHIFVFGIISGLVHVLFAFLMLLAEEKSEHKSIDQHVLGFSGVLFALIVIDVRLGGGDQRSLFGIILVPAWLYPWIMVLLMSLLMPNVSLLGHLSGLIVGYLYQFHILEVMTPSAEIFGRIERKICCCCLGRLAYVGADGQREAHHQPFAVFRHVFGDAPSDDPPAQPYTAGGRAVGEPPRRPSDEAVDGNIEIENLQPDFEGDAIPTASVRQHRRSSTD